MASSESPSQPSFSLPPYPQMIMEAIESVNDKKGSNKTAISKQIESTHQALLPSHSTLLTFHLNQMKKSGQIVMLKNNYMKPGPDAPPKRGRGRPPKHKTPQVAAPPPPPPRSRGRPPMVRDSTEPVLQVASSGSGRPRGRPPKKPRNEPETAATDPVAQVAGERRGRGRPPKVKTNVVAPVGC